MRALRVGSAVSGGLLLAATARVIGARSGSTWSGADPDLLLLGLLASCALLVAVGWVRRLRLPALTALLAGTWLVPDLTGVPAVPLPAATLADAWAWVLPGLLVLTVLSTRGLGRVDAPAAALACAGAVLGLTARTLTVDPFLQVGCWRRCAPNPLVWEGLAGAAPWLSGAAVGLSGAALVLAAAGARGRPAVDRWLTGWGLAGAAALLLALAAGAGPDEGWAVAVHALADVSVVLLGVLLVAGEVHDRLLHRRLTTLAIGLDGGPSPGGFAEAFRTAVGDRRAGVLFWAADRVGVVDGEGLPVPAPSRDDGRRTTTVTRAGRPLAVLVHSPGVDAGRVARALGPVLRLALENDQLRACRLAELREVEESRARILERAMEERRRLERNLHDGAQQRAVSLVLLLRMLAAQAPEADAGPVRAAADRAGALLEELRRVARGIHPAVVADAGLTGALLDLAETSRDVPVTVSGPVPQGLSSTAETTAYELVATAVRGARERGARAVEVRTDRAGQAVVVEVAHDGDAPPDALDLDGLTLRAEALGGALRRDGGPGRWRVRLELPCVS